MEKRYKLLEFYPSLPEWFEVGMEVIYFKKTHPPVTGYYYKSCSLGTVYFSENEIENHPKYWQKVEAPILVSYDGVELFWGMDCFEIIKNTAKYYKGKLTEIDEDCVYFAKEENAKEYILLNEKKFSINDIEKYFNTWVNEKKASSFGYYLKSITNEL